MLSTIATIDEYMAEAAKLLRSMKFGEKLEDGSCLAEDLTEEEQAELANYIYEIAYQEMIKSAGKHCLRKCDFGEYADDFINNFAVVIMKRSFGLEPPKIVAYYKDRPD